jgi:cell fate (sporulation/competence/biofilm development) regulator YlbF (YheA/YmcA/DUF963 family)
MPKFIFLLLLLTLTGCSQDIDFKISYDHVDNLAKGDPVVLDNQPVGKVVGLEPVQGGGNLVEVAIPRESAHAATHEASFILAPDPDRPQHNRIEVVLARPGGKPIADDETVAGSYPNPLSLFPLGELLRGLGDVLRDLRGQVEQFRQDLQKLPESAEAKQLQEEWRALQEAIAKAQNEASDNVKKDVLPKLEKQMDELRKRMEEMQRPAAKPDKALAI